MKKFLALGMITIPCALLWLSCGTYYSSTTGNRYLYDYESAALHPNFLLYHSSDDSSTLYYRMHRNELLFARRDSKSPFQAQVDLRYTLMKVESNALNILDSGMIKLVADQSTGKYIFGEAKLKIPGGNFQLELIATDINRNSTGKVLLSVDKSNTFTPQNFLITDHQTGQAAFGHVVYPGQQLNVHSARSKSSVLCYHITEEVKLPPPPFATNLPEVPSLKSATLLRIPVDSTGGIKISMTQGSYFFTTDPQNESGALVMVANSYFPEVKTNEQLIYPLRFVTSKAEYEEISRSNNPKQLVDNFWLECGGSKDRARELIRVYYNRVREANYYFTTYTEGWRTDRGMIHLVFGQPNRIYKYDDSETWLYGEEGNVASLQFMFRKIRSPLSENLFVLNRDPMFRTHWERAVTAWRNGKVFSD